MNIPHRVAVSLVNALKGGVVPRVGLEYITVGRTLEINAILSDIEMIGDGGASFRFIVGRYGSGKSFLLQTIRNYATASGFVVVDADLSPERRFAGTKGQGLATYKELMKNLSTKSKPDGGALSLILDRWLAKCINESDDPKAVVDSLGLELENMVNGFEFAKAMTLYYKAYTENDSGLKSSIIKWLRGEYQSKREAKSELDVNFIVSDDSWYDFLKVFAAFLVGAGYKGLLVIVDELVNIFKLPNSLTRANNYEKILTMYNDVLQGKAKHIGFLMGGTPQCIEDKYRGVYSYEALRSRLQEGHFSREKAKDLSAPIINLIMLTQEEMYVLIEKLMNIHGMIFNYEPKLTHEDLLYFLTVEYNRVGASTHITPREIIRDFIELINILHQNPNLKPTEVLGSNSFEMALGGISDEEIHSEFTDFEL